MEITSVTCTANQAIWRLRREDRSTYQVATYPNSRHVFIRIANGGWAGRVVHGRKLEQEVRDAIAAYTGDVPDNMRAKYGTLAKRTEAA